MDYFCFYIGTSLRIAEIVYCFLGVPNPLSIFKKWQPLLSLSLSMIHSKQTSISILNFSSRQKFCQIRLKGGSLPKFSNITCDLKTKYSLNSIESPLNHPKFCFTLPNQKSWQNPHPRTIGEAETVMRFCANSTPFSPVSVSAVIMSSLMNFVPIFQNWSVWFSSMCSS